MNKSLIETKVYLINKYINKDYRVDDTTTRTVNGEKIEYILINNLIFRGLEKALEYYQIFELLGTTQNIQRQLFLIQEISNKWNNQEAKYSDKQTDTFIKDYHIDINEIDNLLLMLVNNSLKTQC